MNRIGKRIISSILIMLMLLSMLSGCGEEVTVKNQKKTDSDKGENHSYEDFGDI